MSDSVRPQRRQPTRLLRPWDSPGKNTGVGCHFLLQCMKVKSESEVSQSCLTLSDPMDCSLPGSSIHGILQARVLEWVAIAFSVGCLYVLAIVNSAAMIFFKLEYNCFTLLCQFLLYCKVNQPCVYMYPLSFGFPSHLGHHRTLSSLCSIVCSP